MADTKPVDTEQLYTQADLDRYLQRGERYRQFLTWYDECGKCGNALCRGTELFPVLIDGEVRARCWNCLVSAKVEQPST